MLNDIDEMLLKELVAQIDLEYEQRLLGYKRTVATVTLPEEKLMRIMYWAVIGLRSRADTQE